MAASGLVAQVTAPPPLMHLFPVALDASGQPVTDLTAADFKISDQGKPETIFYFRGPHTEKAAAAGPLEYTNRPGGAMPHPIVILFDLMNEIDADRLDTWHKLSKAISQLDSGDSLYFYVMTLEGDLVPIHAIGPPSADDHTWTQSVNKILDPVMKKASHARSVHLGSEEQVKKTYHQFEVLANQLATLPGRGSIVWVTNGMPHVDDPMKLPCNGDWVNCGLYVAHLAVTLDRDNVSVNSLLYTGDVAPSVNYDLEQLTLLTGGHPFYRSEIGAVVQEVARNVSNAYEIAYDPGAANWDNKFHDKVKVTCERKGVKLQVRQRYYALPDSRPAEDRQKATLVAAYQSPADAASIGLHVKVAPAEKGVHLEMRIDPSDLLLREQGGKFTGGVVYLLSDIGASGPLGDPNVSSFNLDLSKEQHDAVMKDGIPISQDHALTDAVQRVRLIVMDQSTNAIGSLTFPVK